MTVRTQVMDPSAADEFAFEHYEVVTGSANRQTVLTGFLLGGAFKDLAVVNIDDNDARRLRIYAFNASTWMQNLEATLGPEVLFVDVVNIGGRDRLITYERGRLNWFDPQSATERALVAVTANVSPPPGDEIPHVDFTRDVNHDERDDLVVPDTGGFWVFFQTNDGAFADPVKLGTSRRMRVGADGYRHNPWDQGGIHEMDYNRDGRSDLVFWNEDHFEVHTQDEHGLFAPAAKTFTTDVAFDSDEAASLAAPLGIRRRRKDHMPTGDMKGRVLHSLTDMNGDGVADLVVFSLEVIRSRQSSYLSWRIILNLTILYRHISSVSDVNGDFRHRLLDLLVRRPRGQRMKTRRTIGRLSCRKSIGAVSSRPV